MRHEQLAARVPVPGSRLPRLTRQSRVNALIGWLTSAVGLALVAPAMPATLEVAATLIAGNVLSGWKYDDQVTT